MTFIGGYIYKNEVHIIADSAETAFLENIRFTSFNDEHLSSFEETPYLNEHEGKLISEGANKIYNIKNKILLTFNGNVNEGEVIVELLSYSFTDFQSQSISNTILSVLKENAEKTQYIIGFIENNKPCLLHYFNKEDSGTTSENFAIVFASSYDKLSIVFDRTLADSFIGNRISAEESLLLTISVLQYFCLHHQGIKHGVGGFFNGATISKNGIAWVKDTCHIYYSAFYFDKAEKYTIYRVNRDNVAFIISNKNRRYYPVANQKGSSEEVIKKWGEKLLKYTNKGKLDYYVLMSYDTYTMVIISNKNGKRNKISFTKVDGVPAFVFSSFILDQMGRYYNRDIDNEFGLMYCYTNFIE